MKMREKKGEPEGVQLPGSWWRMDATVATAGCVTSNFCRWKNREGKNILTFVRDLSYYPEICVENRTS
jgi:hypothetical protein